MRLLWLRINCTDRTEEIVSKYPIRLVSYSGPQGHIHARIKGLLSVTGNIVCCTDGDSYVEPNWVKEMTKPFIDPDVVGVSSPVVFTNLLTHKFLLSTFVNFRLNWIRGYFNEIVRAYLFWGTSFALRKDAYEKIGGLEPMISIPAKLGTTECPDDFYLAMMLRRIGKVTVTFKTTVRAISKQNNRQDLIRSNRQRREAKKWFRYLKALQLPHERN